MTLDERIIRYLAAIEPAIQGSNGSKPCFKAACALSWGFGLDEQQVFYYLMNHYNMRCVPEWSEGELRHKAAEANVKATGKKPRGHLVGSGAFTKSDLSYPVPEESNKPTVVKIDPATAIEINLKGFRATEEDLYDLSPIQLSEDWKKDAVLLVKNLFQEGEKVNFVTEYTIYQPKDGDAKANPIGTGETVDRDELIERWSMHGVRQSKAGGWMRFNPMDGKGVKDENVTSFRHALIEFDGIPMNFQLSFLAKIPLPISAILTSGGKSVHAWVWVGASDFQRYRLLVSELMAHVAYFGADEKNKNPSRLSRLVGAQRLIGASGDGKQRLLYLNPHPLQKPIVSEEGVMP